MKLSKQDLARKLAKVLRHEPDSLDLKLNDKGWASVDDIKVGFDQYTPYDITRDRIVEAVQDANYGRFEYDDEHDHIRALEGHTTSQVEYQAAEPKGDTYHVVVPSRHRQEVMEYGLRPARKRFTQVFPSYLDALKDGKKRGVQDPCMVEISADEAYHDGTVFYKHNEKWYIEEVDPFHLDASDVGYLDSMMDDDEEED